MTRPKRRSAIVLTESQRQVLSTVPETELLAELVRRRNREPDEQNHPWCHDCAHFKTYEGRGDAPAKYNPCAKRHKLLFWVPRDWESPETNGYYRPVCEDRKAVHEAVRERAMPPKLVY